MKAKKEAKTKPKHVRTYRYSVIIEAKNIYKFELRAKNNEDAAQVAFLGFQEKYMPDNCFEAEVTSVRKVGP